MGAGSRRNLKITAGAITLLIIGECLARFYLGLGTPPLSVTHPTIEYLFKPNQNIRRFGNRFITNEFGMRSDSIQSKRSEPEHSILLFGDSVVNGGSLTDHEDLSSTILQKAIQRTHNDRVFVGNISAGSWGPGNWRAYADEYGFFHANVVVLVISSHDYSDAPTFEPLNKRTHPTTAPPSALLEGITRYLPRYLARLGAEDEITLARIEDTVTNTQAIEASLNDLRYFLIDAESNTEHVLVFQHVESAELGTKESSPGFYRIADLCAELGIKAISLAPYFDAAIATGVSPYRDNIHPNNVGQRIIAKAIFEHLSRLEQ